MRTTIALPTFILAAICCSLTTNSSLRADTIYSVQFENNQGTSVTAVNFSGVEPDAAAADATLGTHFSQSNVWNHLGARLSQAGAFSSSLVDSTGAATGAQLSISHIDGAYNSDFSLPDTYFYSGSNSSFTINGLAPDSAFTLFLYAFNNNPTLFRDEVFTVGNSSFDSAQGTASSLDRNATVGAVTGVTSATGSITGTWDFGANNTQTEIDWAGFQLDVASPAPAPVPEPATLALFGTGVLLLAGAARRRPLS